MSSPAPRPWPCSPSHSGYAGFGGDPAVVGRSIVLNGAPHRIVGVVPAVFRELGRTQIGSAGAAQIFVPLPMDTAQSRGNHTLRVVARLRPETSLDRSRDEMHRVAAGMEQEFPSYLPSAQFPQNTVSLVIRADAQLQAILPAIRAAIREIDAAQPVPVLRPLDEWIDEITEQPRLMTTLAGAFAVAALLLTAVGIYGVISHAVSLRTQEIGVRMAIGAARTSVVGLVLRGGMTWAGGGIVLGLLAAWASSRAIAGLLFNTSAADPLTFGVTALALAGVAALACLVPAIRATRIDPVIALRGD